jgi:hypothetical protein
MNALPSRWSLIKGSTPVAFSLACAALMILAAWCKRGVPIGTPGHTALEWLIQLLVILVIVGISVAGVHSRHPARSGQPR